MTKIQIISTPLTDGSRVFDVRIWQDGQAVRFPAVTETDAEALADVFQTAIDGHANEEIERLPMLTEV